MPRTTTKPTTATVVEATGLGKAYRRGNTVTPVLEGVDLSVKRGECVFLVGPSGSGKSTLLSVLGCILQPDVGSVRLMGQDVFAMSNRARCRLRREKIGFVFQRFQLVRGLSAFDNVKVPLMLQGISSRRAKPHVMKLLEMVGLADRASFPPQRLSAGQCQRVAMARALSGDPDIILADEPTAALDAQNGHDVMKLLRQLASRLKKTVLVVTHDQRIFEYADRVCELEHGRLIEHQLENV